MTEKIREQERAYKLLREKIGVWLKARNGIEVLWKKLQSMEKAYDNQKQKVVDLETEIKALMKVKDHFRTERLVLETVDGLVVIEVREGGLTSGAARRLDL